MALRQVSKITASPQARRHCSCQETQQLGTRHIVTSIDRNPRSYWVDHGYAHNIRRNRQHLLKTGGAIRTFPIEEPDLNIPGRAQSKQPACTIQPDNHSTKSHACNPDHADTAISHCNRLRCSTHNTLRPCNSHTEAAEGPCVCKTNHTTPT